MIPEQIVQQYQSYCYETRFVSMSHNKLCGILKFVRPLCASLPGLNYASAEGAKAFDELADVIDKLGDNHSKGLSWAKDQNEKLKLAKRYFKRDFKLGVRKFKTE